MSLAHIVNVMKSPTKDPVRLTGRFEFNGASAITAAQITAVWIESIAHTATGVWTVTVKPAFRAQAMLAMQATLELAAAGDSQVNLRPYNVALGTFIIDVQTGAATPADLATTNFCSLGLDAKYSGAPDGSGV